MVIPSDVGVGALVELKQYSCRPKTDHSEIKRDQSLNKGMERGQYCSTHGNASWPCTNTRRRGVRYISARPVTDRAT